MADLALELEKIEDEEARLRQIQWGAKSQVNLLIREERIVTQAKFCLSK
jgi:hypothetical protein